jgi:hypothetical protein
MSFVSLYDIPNFILMLMLIILLVCISILGLCLFNKYNYNKYDNQTTGVYLSVGTIVISIVLAFVISNEWQSYKNSEENVIEEANTLYLLYETISHMTNSDNIQNALKQHTCNIINIEFPNMKNSTIISDQVIADNLKISLLGYEPKTNKDEILYPQAISLLNHALALRESRLQTSVTGVSKELWWMIIISFIIIMVMMWFISGDLTYRIIMSSLVITIYATMIFLIVALDYPFRGEFSLSSKPFELILERLNLTCK